MALNVIDMGDCAIARIVLNNYERAKEIFDLSEFNYFETDLVGVLLPDDPQPYLRICMALMQAELNIHYTYPLLYRKLGRGAIALYVEDVDLALKTLKAICAPYSMVQFIPTGGINEKNLKEYLSFSKTLCCGGSWMVKADLINNKQFDRIRELTQEAVTIAKDA